MRFFKTIGAVVITIVFFFSCKKEATQLAHCLDNAETVGVISNRKATVVNPGNEFYIVEENSIDSKLYPCNLPAEFRQHGLSVTVSGEIKKGTNTLAPCCENDFVILKISK